MDVRSFLKKKVRSWITEIAYDVAPLSGKLISVLNVGEKRQEWGFQEYFLVNHRGEIVCNECREFQSNWFDSDGNDLSEPEEGGGFEDYLEFGDYGDIYGEDKED